MYDVNSAFIMFPNDSPFDALRNFHEFMLIKANRGEILPFQEFYGNILYFDPYEFPEELEPLTLRRLRQVQDELRRRYNFENN